MTLEQFYSLVQKLNWNYGKGELVSLEAATTPNTWIAVSQLQNGTSTFTVRCDGKTVFARGHQKSIR